MEVGTIPPQLRPVARALAVMLRRRESAIRQRVERLRLENPGMSREELAEQLIRSTRRLVVSTGAASGAAGIVPGIGTMVAVGTAASQSMFALEQQTELALGIAIIYGRELASSDQQLLEALVVIGIAGGAVRLRDNLLIAGGQRITVAAFRRLPDLWLGRVGGAVAARILGRAMAQRAAASVARVVPLAVGVAAGAGFDWATVTVLGRAAIRYYGRVVAETAITAPGPIVALPAPEDSPDAEASG